MIKSVLTLTVIAFLASASIFVGGLMTNTCYHIAFDRMMTCGATFDIDALTSTLPVWRGQKKADNYRSTSRNLGKTVISLLAIPNMKV